MCCSSDTVCPAKSINAAWLTGGGDVHIWGPLQFMRGPSGVFGLFLFFLLAGGEGFPEEVFTRRLAITLRQR